MAENDQTLTLSLARKNEVYFNWPEIKKFAATPLPRPDPSGPGMNDVQSREYIEFNHKFQTINMCRNLLAARHAGFIEAAPDKIDPFMPEPMMRDDDMRAP